MSAIMTWLWEAGRQVVVLYMNIHTTKLRRRQSSRNDHYYIYILCTDDEEDLLAAAVAVRHDFHRVVRPSVRMSIWHDIKTDSKPRKTTLFITTSELPSFFFLTP